MFIPGTTLTNANLPLTTSTMNNNFHYQQQHHHHQQQQQQQSFFDNLKDSRSNKVPSTMSRKTVANPNFSLDPDLLRELNARYLHDISATRPTNGTNPNLDSNVFPNFLLHPLLRAEHYHQHTHTHEHNLNIFTPPSNPSFHANLNNALMDKLSKSDNGLSSALRTTAVNNFSSSSLLNQSGFPFMFPPFNSNNSLQSTNSTPFSSSSIGTTTTSAATTSSSTTTTCSMKPKQKRCFDTNSVERSPSPPARKSKKWCAAHVRISWMILRQQQRSKDKSSSFDNKKDENEEQKPKQQESSHSLLNNKLSDSTSLSKTSSLPLLPSASSANDLSLSLPTAYQSGILPVTPFNIRPPIDLNTMSSGSFGRVHPSSATAFGGLGTLFPPFLGGTSSTLPTASPSLTNHIDRKADINGSMSANTGLNLDWLRLQQRSAIPSPFISPLPLTSTNNENGSSRKQEESYNSNHEKKRSISSVNNDDDRRVFQHSSMNSNTNSTSSSNSSINRSRSPHRSSHHSNTNSSSNHHYKVPLISSSPPSLSTSLNSVQRKRTSPSTKSSHSSVPLPSMIPPVNFPGLDPLSLSVFDRQRLPAAFASMFAVPPGTNPLFPLNFDPTTSRVNGSSSQFPTNDTSSAMTAALLQREHFFNALRLSQQQEQNIERERAASTLAALNGSLTSMNKTIKSNAIKTERNSPKITEDSTRISPKVLTSPGSHSSSSSSSRSSSSKKMSHVKRVKQSDSPSPVMPSSKENQDNHLKQEAAPIST